MKLVSGKEFSRFLEHKGWVLRRVHGSHHIYGKKGSVVRLSVPVHDNRVLKAVLQHHLLRMGGLLDQVAVENHAEVTASPRAIAQRVLDVPGSET